MTMYPLSPYDDFPEGFCAIRQDSGEPRFYIPASESAKRKLLWIESENTKLRELVHDMWFWCYGGHIDSESRETQMEHIDSVLTRMQELGIRVWQ